MSTPPARSHVPSPSYPQSRPTGELVALMTGSGPRIGDALHADPDAMTDVLAALTRLAALEAATPPEVETALAQADLLINNHRDPEVCTLANHTRRLAQALTEARAELARLTSENEDQHARLMAHAKHSDASSLAAIEYMPRLRRERDHALDRAATLAHGVRLILRKHSLPPSNMQAAHAWERDHAALYAEPYAPTPRPPSPIPSTFVDLCTAGLRLPTEADDFIDSWHDGHDPRPLAQALGLSPEEYARFTTDPTELPRALARASLTAKVRLALAPLTDQPVTPELLDELAKTLTLTLSP